MAGLLIIFLRNRNYFGINLVKLRFAQYGVCSYKMLEEHLRCVAFVNDCGRMPILKHHMQQFAIVLLTLAAFLAQGVEKY